MKHLFKILYFFSLISLGQNHQQNITATVDIENHIVKIKQEVVYFNNSSNELSLIKFQDWNNAFSSKKSAIARRFSDEFIRSFHLASEKDRGYTDIKAWTDESFTNLSWERDEKNLEIINLKLDNPILPFTSRKFTITYLVKIPNEKFTRYGFNGDSKLYLKDWLIAPARYENKGFIAYPNESLDDQTNALSDFKINITLPYNYYLNSNLPIVENEGNHFVLKGEKFLDATLVISRENEFTKYKNELIEVSSSLKSDRISDLQKVLAVDKLTRFVHEKLGNSSVSKILVTEEDYDKNPFYGLNQLPAFLSPFPDDFLYEIKFLKTYLDNYLKANLHLNLRKDNWIYDGIQVYVLMQYIEENYPDMKMMGNISKLKILKSYNAVNIDFNQQYNYLYMLMARKNLDQAVGEPKNRLIKFNEKIANKYRSGLNFKYLDSYLGNNIVENSIKELIENNSNCTCNQYELKYILTKNSPKKIDWFFDTLVNSRELIDFRFGKVKKNDDTVEVNIINKTKTNVPISFYQLKKDSIVHQEWIENIKTDTTLVFPRNEADKLTLNYFNEIPEYNLRNNWKSLKGFFSNNRPLKFNFYRDLEEPYYNQLFYVPEFEFNIYDGLAVGMNINNKSLLNKPFTFSATPFYSSNTQSAVGKFSFLYDNNVRSEGKLYKVRYIAKGSQFHYAPDARYTNFSPVVQFFFRDPNFRVNKSEFIQLKQLYINRERSPYILEQNTENYTVFDAKYGNHQSEGTKHYSFLTDLQLANSFGKLSGEIHYRKLFENNRQITLRFFAGTFIYRDTKSDFFSFGLDRPTDYLFEHDLLGRSESTGIFSQQYIYAEGGFKSKFDTRFANQWMVTTNAAFNIWNWIQVYGDIGLFKNEYSRSKFVYDSGFHLNLVPDYFELFFPVYSSNGFELKEPNYGEKVRFVVTLTPKTLISLFTRKWF
ncbi:MAG: aminopeptidase [Flavobacterium sp.]|nr:aminopeptidase [Flavobacterium sp.]